MLEVICGFPGVGKTQAVQMYPDRLVDLDVPGKTDYVAAIKQLIAEGKTVLVPSWQSLRDEMTEAGIHFLLIYPERKLKPVFMRRYRERGSPEKMVTVMREKWDFFIETCQDQKGCDHYVINDERVFLTDILKARRFK